jgi:hypothetical protein
MGSLWNDCDTQSQGSDSGHAAGNPEHLIAPYDVVSSEGEFLNTSRCE